MSIDIIVLVHMPKLSGSSSPIIDGSSSPIIDSSSFPQSITVPQRSIAVPQTSMAVPQTSMAVPQTSMAVVPKTRCQQFLKLDGSVLQTSFTS